MLDTTEFVLSEPLKFMGVERVSVRSAVTSIGSGACICT